MSAEETVKRYYEAFAAKDAEVLASLYAENAAFSDPVFGKLNGSQTCAMWAMLLGRAVGFSSSYQIGSGEGNHISGEMIVEYKFGKRKRQVINHIRSTFEIADGHIISQVDRFNFWRWATMSMGTFGFAVGWIPAFRNSVKKKALQSLIDYMNKNMS